jgi:hypothetical protein
MFNLNMEKVAAMPTQNQSGYDPQANNLIANHEFDWFRPIPHYSAILWKIK